MSLEEQVKELTAKVEELSTTNAELEKSVAEKDAIIQQKNEDLVGQRKQFKRLSEMSEEEKDAMSQKEIELQERQEALEAEQEAFRKEQEESRMKEVNARKENAIKKLVGDNEEYAEKVRSNYERIKDSAEAQTEEEVVRVATEAFNMLGDDRPEPVSNAVNGSGGSSPQGLPDTGFADSPQGKGLAEQMGLQQPPAEGGGDPNNAQQ